MELSLIVYSGIFLPIINTMALYAEIECCSKKNCKLNSLSGTTMMTSKKNG